MNTTKQDWMNILKEVQMYLGNADDALSEGREKTEGQIKRIKDQEPGWEWRYGCFNGEPTPEVWDDATSEESDMLLAAAQVQNAWCKEVLPEIIEARKHIQEAFNKISGFLTEKNRISFEAIRDYVIINGFGTKYIFLGRNLVSPNLCSAGIRYAVQQMPDFAKEVSEAYERFLKGDWGTFYASYERAVYGNEWGSYPSRLFPTEEIIIHRENGKTMALFLFER